LLVKTLTVQRFASYFESVSNFTHRTGRTVMERSGVDCFGSSLLTATKTSTNLNIMRLREGDKLVGKSPHLTCTDVNHVTPPLSMGEDFIEYTFENDYTVVVFRDDEVANLIADGMEVQSV
jgi:hypothetical protein